MRYLLLIYTSEANDSQLNQADQEAEVGAYYAFTNEVRESGALLGGEALHPTATATTVRVQNGQTITTDGPFAETKEQLGGFYMLNCQNLDEAMAWAAKIPGVRRGAIEIRSIVEWT